MSNNFEFSQRNMPYLVGDHFELADLTEFRVLLHELD